MVKVKNIFNLTFQIILICLSIIILRPAFNNNYNFSIHYISIYGSIIALILWILIINQSHSIFSNISLLYLSFVFFQFGIPILYAFDKNYYSDYVQLFSSGTVIKGEIYTIFCIQLFCLGIFFSKILIRRDHRLIFSNTTWANNDAMVVKAGTLLFFFSAVIYVPLITYAGFILHSRNYSLSIISKFASQYYFTSAFLILCYSKNRKLRVTIYSLFIFVCIAAMMTGGRTQGLVPLMVLLVYVNDYEESKVRKIYGRKLIRNLFLGIGFCIILFLIVYIAFVRTKGGSAQQLGISGFIQAFLNELGFNFTSLLFVMSSIGLYGLKLGASYIGAFPALIPESFDFTGFVKYYFNNIAGSNWLQITYGNVFGFGLGFSLVAESYYDFGNYGILIILVLGFLIGGLIAKEPSKCSNWEKYVEIVLLLGFITVFRRDFYQLLKQIEYSIFFVALYLYLFEKITKNNNVN